jgi:predicted transcriptional regulator of viral defense system
MNQMLMLARRKVLLRSRDLAAHQIPREYLKRACDKGMLQRVGRGLYRIPGTMTSENQSLAEVCRRAPAAVVCLLSALRFHDLTTQNPFEVWVAVSPKAHMPRLQTLALRAVRFSGESLTYGIQTHDVSGVPVRIYSVAKTVADCFKFRNKIGVDVAIEALRDCLKQRRASVDEILEAARVCRVQKVISPYMEALL